VNRYKIHPKTYPQAFDKLPEQDTPLDFIDSLPRLDQLKQVSIRCKLLNHANIRRRLDDLKIG
jgi:hypothetical protein